MQLIAGFRAARTDLHPAHAAGQKPDPAGRPEVNPKLLFAPLPRADDPNPSININPLLKPTDDVPIDKELTVPMTEPVEDGEQPKRLLIIKLNEEERKYEDWDPETPDENDYERHTQEPAESDFNPDAPTQQEEEEEEEEEEDRSPTPTPDMTGWDHTTSILDSRHFDDGWPERQGSRTPVYEDTYAAAPTHEAEPVDEDEPDDEPDGQGSDEGYGSS